MVTENHGKSDAYLLSTFAHPDPDEEAQVSPQILVEKHDTGDDIISFLKISTNKLLNGMFCRTQSVVHNIYGRDHNNDTAGGHRALSSLTTVGATHSERQ